MRRTARHLPRFTSSQAALPLSVWDTTTDLARQMIELSGLTVYDEATGDGDIEIKITGLRPGEKLYEELLIGEAAGNSPHPKIKFAAENFVPWHDLNADLTTMRHAVDAVDAVTAKMLLTKLVVGFSNGDVN